MKQLLVIAIALASIAASAQTETTPAAATTPAKAAETKEVTTAIKKQTKATKKKKAVKAGASTKAPAATPVVTPAPAVVPAAAETAPTTMVTPAAGTSTATAAAPAAEPKKWAVKTQLYSTTDFNNTQNIQNLTTISGSYKVLPKLGVNIGQTFETLTNGRDTSDETRELTKSNNFRTSYSEFGLSTTLPKIGASDDIALSVKMKVMGGESEYTTTGGYSTAYNFVETNLSIPFTLSPKWSVSIDSQWRAVDNKPKWKSYKAADGDYRFEDQALNSNRFFVIPGITYTINDFVSVYQSAGWIGSFKDAEAVRRNYERFYAETGVTFTPVKNFNLTFMVDQDKAIYASPSSGIDVTDYSFYKPTESANGPDATIDAVSYEAVIAYTF